MFETSSTRTGSQQAPVDMESEDMCWICLDGIKDLDLLINPCRCPRKVHPRCLARWQLQQAGRLEETNCRFCHCNLADWKASLTPDNLKPDVQRVQPIMVVYFEGQIHRIPVKQGPDGLKEFTHRIRELFRLPDDVDISLTFGCKEPLSGQHLKLEGIGAFDAAVHCASVAAAERQQKLKSSGGTEITPGNPSAGSDSSAPAAAENTTPSLPPTSDTAAVADGPAARQTSSRLQGPVQPTEPHSQNLHLSQLERAASALGGIFASSSAPASAQTSGGGADISPALLHPTSSAPVFSHYASDASNFISSHAASSGSSRLQLENSYPFCHSSPAEPASASHSVRTSSGGGSSGPSLRHTNAAAPAAAAATAATAAYQMASPFQMAAGGNGLYMRRQSSEEAEEQRNQYHHQVSAQQCSGTSSVGLQTPRSSVGREQRPPLTGRQTVPYVGTPDLTAAPLAGAISEPMQSRLGSTSSAGAFPHRQPQQHQPCDNVRFSSGSEALYTGFPYSAAPSSLPPSSPYAAPLLPPLPVRRPVSPYPTPAAAGPPAPRDHYAPQFPAAATMGSAQTEQACSAAPSIDLLASRHQAHSYGRSVSEGEQQQQSQARSDLGQVSLEPSPLLAPSTVAEPRNSEANIGSEDFNLSSSESGSGTFFEGPATPSQPVARRATTSPTSLPRPPSTPSVPQLQQLHHSAIRPIVSLGPVHSHDTASEAAGAPSAAEYRFATRHIRQPSTSCLRAAELALAGGVPPSTDEPASLGSLTGRLKFSLRAFSKKVARSLNFQKNHVAAAGPCPGVHPVAQLSSVVETEADVQAEAEVETTGGCSDCLAAAVAAALAGAVPGNTAATVSGQV